MREHVVLQLAQGAALPTVEALAAMGAGGIACDAGDVVKHLPHLKESFIRLAAVTAEIDIRNAATEVIVQDTLMAAGQLASPLVLLRLTSSDRYDRPSAPRAMPAAAAAVARLADAAQRCGSNIALEAAAGTWMRHPEDAVRVAMRVNRMHVGVAVSLTDFAGNDPASLAQRVRLVTPKLLAVRPIGRRIPEAHSNEARENTVWRELVATGYAGMIVIEQP